MNLDTYLFAAVVAVILGLGIWGYVERQHVATLTAQNAVMASDLTAAQIANGADLQTIEQLKGANQKYADDAKASAAGAAAAVSDAQAARSQLAAKAARLAAQSAAGAKVPACAAFLAVDLAQACPAVAAAVKGAAR